MSNQTDLFNDYRAANSREAHRAKETAPDKIRIIDAIWSFQRPCNAHEIATRAQMDYHAVQRRMSELVRAGSVELAGVYEFWRNGKKLKYQTYKLK